MVPQDHKDTLCANSVLNELALLFILKELISVYQICGFVKTNREILANISQKRKTS